MSTVHERPEDVQPEAIEEQATEQAAEDVAVEATPIAEATSAEADTAEPAESTESPEPAEAAEFTEAAEVAEPVESAETSEASAEETPAADGAPQAPEAESAPDEEESQELAALDDQAKELGLFELVQELEYAPAPKPKGKAAEQEPDTLLEIRNVADARQILESLLFATNEPLSVARLSKMMNNLHPRSVRGLLLELQLEYDNRGSAIQIVEVAGGFQMGTRPHLADWVFRMHKHRKRNPLSPATLETLAIIAYKQPITRGEIETIRGVESGATARTLQDLGLIDVVGKREIPGRPQLYGTTDQFLKTFGLKALADLPSIQELKQLFAAEQVLKPNKAEKPKAEEAKPEEATPDEPKAEEMKSEEATPEESAQAGIPAESPLSADLEESELENEPASPSDADDQQPAVDEEIESELEDTKAAEEEPPDAAADKDQ